MAADLCHYPASCRGRGGAGAPLALPTPSPTPQKGEAAPGETVCPAARRHSPLHHFCWWNKFVANPIKKFGYVGKGRTAMALLKHEIMDKILLRRTKLQCADVLALPPRCAPGPGAHAARGLHSRRAGGPDIQGPWPPPWRRARPRAWTGWVLHREVLHRAGCTGWHCRAYERLTSRARARRRAAASRPGRSCSAVAARRFTTSPTCSRLSALPLPIPPRTPSLRATRALRAQDGDAAQGPLRRVGDGLL